MLGEAFLGPRPRTMIWESGHAARSNCALVMALRAGHEGSQEVLKQRRVLFGLPTLRRNCCTMTVWHYFRVADQLSTATNIIQEFAKGPA